MAREWYIDANRQSVNLATIRGGNGKATATVYRVVEQPGGALLRSQWARSGADLPTEYVTQAQAVVTTDPLPTDPVPGSTLGADAASVSVASRPTVRGNMTAVTTFQTGHGWTVTGTGATSNLNDTT